MGTLLNLCLMAGGFIMTAILGVTKRFNILVTWPCWAAPSLCWPAGSCR